MRTSTPRRRRSVAALVVAAALPLVAGCGGYDATPLPRAEQVTASDGPAPAATCTNRLPDDLRSYRPEGDFMHGPTVQAIRDRGRLVAGVAADSLQLGARNPFEGQIEGFDIDMVKAVAKRIFGSDDPKHLVLKVITPAQRFSLLEDHTVDVVSRNMTINCERWRLIGFSQEYLRSGQKVLVGRGAGIRSVDDLAGKRVCAPAGTTSIANIQKIAPKAIPVTATNDSECLVKFQNGEADALSTDDTVLAGLAQQDPYAVVLDSDRLTQEPYGIGANRNAKDLIMLMNDTLEQMRRDGRWQASYDRWLEPALGPATQPQPVYGR